MASIPADIYTPASQNRDTAAPGILIITAKDTEDLEFFYPYYRFIEAGYRVDVATPDGGAFKAKHGLGLSHTKKTSEVTPTDYAMLYIPGGKAPAHLKKDGLAVELPKFFIKSGKPVAAICHGPQLLAEADIIKGRRIAAWPEVEKEVAEAGAIYVNAEAVTDGLLITGRWPADLPAFMKAVFKALPAFMHDEDRGHHRAAA
jgi:protease I